MRRDLALKAQRRVLELCVAPVLYWVDGLAGTWNEVRNWRPGVGNVECGMF